MDVLALSGGKKGTVELPDAVFRAEGRPSLLWESVRGYLANQRQGTAKTKTRAEVSGTGAKPYRQKHTGRARHGSRRSPLFRTGGVVFGPRPRDYGFDIPKKRKQKAMSLALTARHAEGAVKVVEDFGLEAPKTKELVTKLAGLGLEGSVLLLVPEADESMNRAGRNVPWLTVLPAAQANVYEVLNHDHVVFTEKGLGRFLNRSKPKPGEPAAPGAAE